MSIIQAVSNMIFPRPPEAPAAAPPDDDLEQLVASLVQDADRRITDRETAYLAFAALRRCREMFEEPTAVTASIAKASVVKALSAAHGREIRI